MTNLKKYIYGKPNDFRTLKGTTLCLWLSWRTWTLIVLLMIGWAIAFQMPSLGMAYFVGIITAQVIDSVVDYD